MGDLHPAAAALVAVAAVLTAGATVWRFGLGPVVRLGLELRELLQDLRGVPADPERGRPARPGLISAVAAVDSKLEDHLVWSAGMTQELKDSIQEHLAEAEHTRQAGHREAERMWAALEALSGHRDADMRTRHDDDPEEKP